MGIGKDHKLQQTGFRKDKEIKEFRIYRRMLMKRRSIPCWRTEFLYWKDFLKRKEHKGGNHRDFILFITSYNIGTNKWLVN